MTKDRKRDIKELEKYEVIDFHVHVYPQLPWPKTIEPLRQQATNWLRPLSKLQQSAQPWLRLVPSKLRPLTDELGVPMVIPHLLVESDIFDLEREMLREGVSKAVVVPHPPIMSNDFVFYESKRIHGAIPAVFIDPDSMKSASDLVAFYNQGVRLFKINPLQSGVPVEAPYYREFLSFLNAKKAVVLIHTGEISSHLFRSPKGGDISEYEPWFREFPDIHFVAAHMNFHEPEKAILMAQKYDNLYLLTSWQPSETLKKAIKAVGAQKILFASDWPLLGENMRTQKERLWSLFQSGDIDEEALSAIFSGNAQKLLQVH